MARRRGYRKNKPVDDVEHALAAAYRLLIFRDRSRNELIQRLLEKGFSSGTVSEAIEILEDEGFIDDFEFARAFVRSRMSKGWAPRLIHQHLVFRFGIEPGTASRALAEEYDPDVASRVVLRLMGIKFRSMQGMEPQKIRRSLIGYALRRGFSPAEAMELTNKIMKGEDSG